MATTGRQPDPPLEEQLLNQTFEFDFHQAIRLLEKLRPHAHPLGEGSDPLREALAIESRITMSPSGADLQNLEMNSPETRPVLTVNFLGLAGIQGPLPTPYTEILIERLRNKDENFKDFLDIFNHRLASFWHRMRKKVVLGISQIHARSTPAGKSLLDLAGIGPASLHNRLAIPDEALLAHASAFWKRPRSQIGLQRLLQATFNLPILVSQFQGGWMRAPERDWTRIGSFSGEPGGKQGRHQVLGKSAVLGQRSWCQTAGIVVYIPPLTYEQYTGFQKESRDFQQLRDLTNLYMGEGYQLHLTFSIQSHQIPPVRLNGQFGLGRTTWLTRGGGSGFSRDPEVSLVVEKKSGLPDSVSLLPKS